MQSDSDSIKQHISENETIIQKLNEQLERRTNEIKIIQSISDEIINSLDPESIFNRSMQLLDEVFGFHHSHILLKKENEDVLYVVACHGYENSGLGAEVKYGEGILGTVARHKKIMRVSGIQSKLRIVKMMTADESKSESKKLPGLPKVDSQMVIPLVVDQRLIGVYSVESEDIGAFKAIDELILKLVGSQIATAIENAMLFKKQERLVEAYRRFVPEELHEMLGKESILDIKRGDQVQGEYTILFSDIRGFTSISEQMTPQQNFDFINEYLGFIVPAIKKNGGFVDKYIGDAIMAIFPNKPADAVRAAREMTKNLAEFNRVIQSRSENFTQIKSGIGIHTGTIMAGIIGADERFEGTVISDAVNIASRLESLTKEMSCAIIASDAVVRTLSAEERGNCSELGDVNVKGKKNSVRIYKLDD
ncbi:GAF domain-containing protein [bacterium]|nr:MAG: GAF domain-containing protein [bacterium]